MQIKKRYLFGFCVLIASGIVSGIIIGTVYLSFFYKKPTDYSKYTQSGLRDNEAAIVAQYGDSDLTTLSGTNAFIIAEHKSKNQQTLTLNAQGSIDTTFVKQTLYTTRYHDAERGLYYVENISKGGNIMGINTNIAERNYYDKETEQVTIYQGSNVRETSADFNMDNPNKTMTLAEWENFNGTTPLSFQPYIVSSKTVIEATTPQACPLSDGTNGFYFRLKLNHKAAYLYVKQIKNLSGLSEYPSFDYINLEVYLNADGTFNKISCDELYYVNMGFSVGTKSKLTYQFSYNGAIIIPGKDIEETE